MKLLLSWCMFCVHPTIMHQFTVLLIQSHMHEVHVVTWHLHVLQNDHDLLHVTAAMQGWEWIVK